MKKLLSSTLKNETMGNGVICTATSEGHEYGKNGRSLSVRATRPAHTHGKSSPFEALTRRCDERLFIVATFGSAAPLRSGAIEMLKYNRSQLMRCRSGRGDARSGPGGQNEISVLPHMG